MQTGQSGDTLTNYGYKIQKEKQNKTKIQTEPQID